MKKQTNIRADFFPHGEQYKTVDADVDRDNDASTAAPSGARTSSHDSLSPEIQEEIKEGKIILVDWDGPDDPQNPMNWSTTMKWINTGLLCAMCLFIGLATAAYGSGVSRMCKHFDARMCLTCSCHYSH